VIASQPLSKQSIKRGSFGGTDAAILFIFSPAIALIVALRNHNLSWVKNLIWVFTIYFGYTFVVGEQMDSLRYGQGLVLMARQQVGSLADFFSLIYQKETGYVDVLQPLLTFLVSRITTNSRILFAVFGFVFGYFYSRNVSFLFSYVDGKFKREALPFLILAALVIAIWQINGFRFWTAAHVFILGLFTAFKKDTSKVKGILICCSSIFIHFSFALPVLLFFLLLMVGNRLVIFFAIYTASFFITQISPQLLRGGGSFVPAIFQERTEGYTNEEYVKGRKQLLVTANWYVEGRNIAIRYTINLLLIVLFFRYRLLIQSSKMWTALLSYFLLLTTGINLLTEVASIARFELVANVILFSFLFVFTQNFRQRVFPLWSYLPFLGAAMLYIVVEIRIGFETTSLLTVLGNPLIAPFLSNDFPLINFFK
jgi:hypothetical protein